MWHPRVKAELGLGQSFKTPSFDRGKIRDGRGAENGMGFHILFSYYVSTELIGSIIVGQLYV